MAKMKVYKAIDAASSKVHEIEVVPTFDKYGDLLTPQNMADETGMCVETIRSLIKSGQLPGVKIGQRYFVPKSRMLEFLGLGVL